MNYELAKELKNAGFPQEYHDCVGDEHGACVCSNDRWEKDVMKPTLSELIEAMPARVKYLDGLINDAIFRLEKMWAVSGPFYRAMLDGDFETKEYADKYKYASITPEEAVARLWIALNTKV